MLFVITFALSVVVTAFLNSIKVLIKYCIFSVRVNLFGITYEETQSLNYFPLYMLIKACQDGSLKVVYRCYRSLFIFTYVRRCLLNFHYTMSSLKFTGAKEEKLKAK